MTFEDSALRAHIEDDFNRYEGNKYVVIEYDRPVTMYDYILDEHIWKFINK